MSEEKLRLTKEAKNEHAQKSNAHEEEEKFKANVRLPTPCKDQRLTRTRCDDERNPFRPPPPPAAATELKRPAAAPPRRPRRRRDRHDQSCEQSRQCTHPSSIPRQLASSIK
jgi:hypothetical protein